MQLNLIPPSHHHSAPDITFAFHYSGVDLICNTLALILPHKMDVLVVFNVKMKSVTFSSLISYSLWGRAMHYTVLIFVSFLFIDKQLKQVSLQSMKMLPL